MDKLGQYCSASLMEIFPSVVPPTDRNCCWHAGSAREPKHLHRQAVNSFQQQKQTYGVAFSDLRLSTRLLPERILLSLPIPGRLKNNRNGTTAPEKVRKKIKLSRGYTSLHPLHSQKEHFVSQKSLVFFGYPSGDAMFKLWFPSQL